MGKIQNLSVLERLGGEAGCLRLAAAFYSRVAKNEALRPLFPGKSLRCATEEFSAFLVQFLDGEDSKTQYRWWLSLRESHARFDISEMQRSEWLRLMCEAIQSTVADVDLQHSLAQFFGISSAYIMRRSDGVIREPELESRWKLQIELDTLIEAVAQGRDEVAIELARAHLHRKSVMVGIFATMMDTGRDRLTSYVLECIEYDCEIRTSFYNGRSLLHHAAAAHCLPVVQRLLAEGVDPNLLDSAGHTPLYRAAHDRNGRRGVQVVEALVDAGAIVDHSGGVNRSTPLHEAARHGAVHVAQSLLRAGANIHARDRKGLTPIDRAKNLRRTEVLDVLHAAATT